MLRLKLWRRYNAFFLLTCLFLFSILLRVINIERDLGGDESYYYYLSRDPSQYINYHRDHPPILYLLYHFFTADIVSFRLVNVVIGSLIPCLVYMILDTYDVRKYYKILGATLPVFFSVFVRYSTVVFLDTLCTFFFLIGVYFYRRESWRMVDLFFGLSILTKEVAIIGIAVFMGYLIIKHRSIRFIFPTIIISIVVLLLILIPFGGWEQLWYGVQRGYLGDFFLFSITPACLPLLVILLYKKYIIESIFFVIYPLAFFIYQASSEWYFLLPLSFNIVSIMIALNEIHNLHLTKNSYIKYFILIFFLSNIALTSYNQVFTTSSFLTYSPHQLKDVTNFITKNHRGIRATIIDCFWSYSLYPFGTYLNVIHTTYTHYNITIDHYVNLINETGVAVIGMGEYEVNHEIREFLFQLFANKVVFENSHYIVIDLNKTIL